MIKNRKNGGRKSDERFNIGSTETSSEYFLNKRVLWKKEKNHYKKETEEKVMVGSGKWSEEEAEKLAEGINKDIPVIVERFRDYKIKESDVVFYGFTWDGKYRKYKVKQFGVGYLSVIKGHVCGVT
jgi:hypothetical protein